MSWISDIEQLPDIKKAFVISIPVVTPFWFISIFLFKHSFYLHNEFYIIALFSYCLTILWYLMNLVLSVVIAYFIGKATDRESQLVACGAYSICYLAILIFVSYLLKLDFLTFIYCCFGYIVFRILWVFSFGKFLRKAAKEMNS